MAAVKLKDLCYTKFAKGAHAPVVLPWFRNTRKETAAMKYGFYMFLGNRACTWPQYMWIAHPIGVFTTRALSVSSCLAFSQRIVVSEKTSHKPAHSLKTHANMRMAHYASTLNIRCLPKRDSFSNDAVPIDKLILPMSSSKSSVSKPYLEKQLREFGLTGFEGRLDAMIHAMIPPMDFHGFLSLQFAMRFFLLAFLDPRNQVA